MTTNERLDKVIEVLKEVIYHCNFPTDYNGQKEQDELLDTLTALTEPESEKCCKTCRYVDTQEKCIGCIGNDYPYFEPLTDKPDSEAEKVEMISNIENGIADICKQNYERGEKIIKLEADNEALRKRIKEIKLWSEIRMKSESKKDKIIDLDKLFKLTELEEGSK